jgi:hypothetical protein
MNVFFVFRLWSINLECYLGYLIGCWHCNTGSGQKWTKVGRNQWKNGYGKCLDYSGSKFVQKPCKVCNVVSSDSVFAV